MLATLALGWAVGRGSTPIDDWFSHATGTVLGEQPRWLLTFTSGWLMLAVTVVCLVVALSRRQWALATAVLACPFAVTAVTVVLKHLFDRRNGPYLEYPSGHTALLVAVLGMMVLVAGSALARIWALAAAILLSLLGILGLVGCGYHYVTDTVGAVMLATALVSATARLTSACDRAAAPVGDQTHRRRRAPAAPGDTELPTTHGPEGGTGRRAGGAGR
ncbi:phosphatase PAP2 family protein [Mycolicibacter nonchromogenicus]|uniref:phosphatase PAP2 family protein n=1 Tax=Mycolicibacter nonchromogenicus TaxID=1782 RepID=UPI001F443B28|nr:phosphatase PAP2 family protein [Mycolicibacter nonchromogenicus]